jgi:hypothetical protein
MLKRPPWFCFRRPAGRHARLERFERVETTASITGNAIAKGTSGNLHRTRSNIMKSTPRSRATSCTANEPDEASPLNSISQPSVLTSSLPKTPTAKVEKHVDDRRSEGQPCRSATLSRALMATIVLRVRRRGARATGRPPGRRALAGLPAEFDHEQK